mmetsp:Transcript_4125/g.6097  ORF Transcript_4125/g.6097 Transcript_4125/m.6097 type:complete len:152 (+) Transcript_4125:20-475(+)
MDPTYQSVVDHPDCLYQHTQIGGLLNEVLKELEEEEKLSKPIQLDILQQFQQSIEATTNPWPISAEEKKGKEEQLKESVEKKSTTPTGNKRKGYVKKLYRNPVVEGTSTSYNHVNGVFRINGDRLRLTLPNGDSHVLPHLKMVCVERSLET